MDDLIIKNNVVIPASELTITTSRAGGPGGQHVNKSDTRVTVRWNVQNTRIFDDLTKERVLHNLQSRLTSDGDIIISNSASRSQQQNKVMALGRLAQEIRKALHVPKKRRATRISPGAQAARLKAKAERSEIKKMRTKKFSEY